MLNRRELLKRSLLAAPALAASRASALNELTARLARANRFIPDFSAHNIMRFTVGLRPYRSSGIRLEREAFANKILVHNYGHGGGGITLSWGSAEFAAELIRDQSRAQAVAVLGGGVIGLSTAHELRARGFEVTVYAEKWHPEITSSVAGGQWSPSFTGKNTTVAERLRYDKIVERSYLRFAQFRGEAYGVRLRDNIICDPTETLLHLQLPTLAPLQHLDRAPFAGVQRSCDIARAWLIEPPIYLPALTNRLRSMGVQFVTRSFHSIQDVTALSEAMIFNCLGLGALRITADPKLFPIRGRLIHLRPDPRVDYLLLNDGYIFGRRDAIILGGTFDRNAWNVEYNESDYRKILRIQNMFFNLPERIEDLSRVPYLPTPG